MGFHQNKLYKTSKMKKFLIISFVFAFIAGIANAQQSSTDKTGQNSQEVRIEVIAQISNSWDGKPLPNYPSTAPQISMVRYTFPPKIRLEPHRHFIINFGVMLKGELTLVTLDGREKTFKAGDPIVEMIGDAHYGENRGDETAEVIIYYVGTEGLNLKEKVE